MVATASGAASCHDVTNAWTPRQQRETGCDDGDGSSPPVEAMRRNGGGCGLGGGGSLTWSGLTCFPSHHPCMKPRGLGSDGDDGDGGDEAEAVALPCWDGKTCCAQNRI